MEKKEFRVGTAEALKEELSKIKNVTKYKRVRSVYLGAIGHTGKEVAEMVGYSKNHVHRIWNIFRTIGIEKFLEETNGKNRSRAHFSREEEVEFLKPFLEKAEAGGILVVNVVHEALEKRIGKKLFKSVTYDMLHRQGWRKLAPRKKHPKTNKQFQEHFRENAFPPTAK